MKSKCILCKETCYDEDLDDESVCSDCNTELENTAINNQEKIFTEYNGGYYE